MRRDDGRSGEPPALRGQGRVSCAACWRAQHHPTHPTSPFLAAGVPYSDIMDSSHNDTFEDLLAASLALQKKMLIVRMSEAHDSPNFVRGPPLRDREMG